VDAVNEWLSDDSKVFHLMRDSAYHTALVMGGMWGAKVSAMRPQLATLVHRILNHQETRFWVGDSPSSHFSITNSARIIK